LSDFINMPKRPGIKGLQLFTGERSQGAQHRLLILIEEQRS
jgi:hypothetical protein